MKLSIRRTTGAVTTSRSSVPLATARSVAAGQGIGARVITGDRRGQVRDQRLGAAVDDRQQFVADRPGIRHVNVLGQRDDRPAAGPLHRADVCKHGTGPLARQAARAASTAARGVVDD